VNAIKVAEASGDILNLSPALRHRLLGRLSVVTGAERNVDPRKVFARNKRSSKSK
jgi:hypothetical protein